MVVVKSLYILSADHIVNIIVVPEEGKCEGLELLQSPQDRTCGVEMWT
jgi:hypothetical protein